MDLLLPRQVTGEPFGPEEVTKQVGDVSPSLLRRPLSPPLE